MTRRKEGNRCFTCLLILRPPGFFRPCLPVCEGTTDDTSWTYFDFATGRRTPGPCTHVDGQLPDFWSRGLGCPGWMLLDAISPA